MNDRSDTRLRHLADAVAHSQRVLNHPARRIADSLLDDETYTHAQAEQELPSYVTDELRGQPVAELYPLLNRHLLHCEDCADLYVFLLADQSQELAPVIVPVPSLKFLRALQRRRFIERATEAILNKLHPAGLAELSIIAEVFFDQVKDQVDRVTLQPTIQTAFNFSANTPVTLRYLAASATATQRLTNQLLSDKAISSSADTEIGRLIHQIALKAASDLKLRKQAQPFANYYTTWVTDHLDELLDFHQTIDESDK